MRDVRTPNDHQRLTMYGQTGSGKTVAGLWHLSQRSYLTRPWLLFDFKGDDHIAELPVTDELEPGKVPKKPGLYVTRPIPESDDERVEQSLWSIWRQERTGVYIDEGYMIPRGSKGYNALLTQGRSKQTPVITLSQRPVWMSRFAISEADFHQVFFLADEADRNTVQRFIPHTMAAEKLPPYHSFYYDVGKRDFTPLKPVPQLGTILQTFEDRLHKSPRFFSI